ncbi:MAG: hypothetical protein EFKGCFLK_01542 [Rhodocyclaceae bacterium]|nr:MAG: alpha/beta hydrolase [Rhodocyclaceae bacterium]MBE7421911.1 alpha/beta hydrolase [Zoogloeaceae bacterium]MBV6407974.1 hypothetical protein [Rhodocyclaceae bacterium]MCK6384332.1 lysophospholipase [Rhodocyclaceae bacterium]CAG0929041.1 hypothetical protein RHDC3_00931 [Rhodocyclaceae bacterium]
MRRFAFLLCFVAFPSLALSAEIVRLPSREGVTQSFLLFHQGERPQALALLFPGGDGLLRIRGGGSTLCRPGEEGEGERCIQLDMRGNFLVRTVGLLRDARIAAAIIDAPSDLDRLGMRPAARLTAEHVRDVRAILDWLRQRFPAAKVFLVGTSAGTLSAAHAGKALDGDLDGIVLTASVTNARHPWFSVGGFYGLAKFDFSGMGKPVLLVHHEEDACVLCPFGEAQEIAEKHRFPLVKISGGLPPKSGPCDALSPHGFYGREQETVDAIKRWILEISGR